MTADTLTALAAVIAAVGVIVTAVLSYLNRQAAADAKERADDAAHAAQRATAAAEASQRAIVRTEAGVFELGKRVDGRLEELLKATADLARAEGMASGREQSEKGDT